MTFREARRAAGLTIDETVRLSGYSPTSVYAFDNDRIKMGKIAIIVFSSVFDISPWELSQSAPPRERRKPKIPVLKHPCVVFNYREWDEFCVRAQNVQCQSCMYCAKVWEKEYVCTFMEHTGTCRDKGHGAGDCRSYMQVRPKDNHA